MASKIDVLSHTHTRSSFGWADREGIPDELMDQQIPKAVLEQVRSIDHVMSAANILLPFLHQHYVAAYRLPS